MWQHEMKRRDFIKSAAILTAASSVGCKIVPDHKVPLGVQLYSVRKDCAANFPATLSAVAAIGYQGVEFAGYYNYSAKELRKILDDNGLKCCGTHTHLNTLTGEELEKTVEYNQILGNKYLICPSLPEEKRRTIQDWYGLAELFNQISEKVKAAGMRVGYHNHTFEFQPLDGQIPWDVFAVNTNKNVILQLDTSNASHGGVDAVAVLKKYPGRAGTVHLKEYSRTNDKALIGEGDIDWQQVFAFCESAGGTEWYIIEEEKDAYPPLEAIERCFKNYRKLRQA